MSEWIEIGPVESIPRLGARVVSTAEGDIAIFRSSDDRLFALRDHCPHQGGPLSQGIVYGTKVACPLHNWSIDLQTGEAVAPDHGCTHSYPLQVEAGVVYIGASSQQAAS